MSAVNSTPAPVIGVIGLGIIGGGIAVNLRASGFQLVLYDIRTEATLRYEDYATIANSPAEVARAATVVVVAVVNDEQVHEVLSGPEGALVAGAPDTAFVLVSTVTRECVVAIGSEADALAVPIIDCGVSGGPSAAASGNLVCMCGGDPEVVADLAPVFDAIGSLTVHMGRFGAGLAAKLARNLVQYGSWLAAYEGQLLAEASGIELSKLAQVIRASDQQAGGTTALMFRTTVAPFSESDDPGLVGAMQAGAALARKDLEAAMALADELDVTLPLAPTTQAHCDEVFGVGVVT